VVSGNRMMVLINSLLDVGRLEDGKMLLHKEDVPLQALLDKSAGQVSALGHGQDVSITVEVLPGAETLHADADLTQRILINLLSNAVKYSPPGSAVELRAEPDASGMVKISVTDHGPGIEKQWADKLFNSYVQVPVRQAGIGVGTGLGLSFSRLAVEAQGGRIWLESEVGAGSTFIFTLPRNA
jgi:signal transduction histidine kinase